MPKLRFNGRFEEKPITGTNDDAMIYPGEVRDFPDDKYTILLGDPLARYEPVDDSVPEERPEYDASLPAQERVNLREQQRAALNKQLGKQ